jgi:hypothetical protein
VPESRLHYGTPKYIAEVMVPSAQAGAKKADATSRGSI